MEEQRVIFNARALSRHLQEGETLEQPPAREQGDIRYVLGYEVYPITDAQGETGNTVFLVMPNRGDAVEAVRLVGDVELRVRAVEGTGLAVVYDGETREVTEHTLSADEGQGSVVRLKKGDEYAYLNVGTEPFVVRDDCVPSFKPEYEVPASNPELLRLLGQLGLRQPPQQ